MNGTRARFWPGMECVGDRITILCCASLFSFVREAKGWSLGDSDFLAAFVLGYVK